VAVVVGVVVPHVVSVNAAATRQWRKTQSPPAPLEVKAGLIRQYSVNYGIRTFVETGTFFGDMLDALRDDFDLLTSIELEPDLAAKARERFRDLPKIRVVQGDSGLRLTEAVAALEEPAIFWLDAHYSGGVTAAGESETPITAELNGLFAARLLNHVILIDDARLFGNAPDYPSLREINDLVSMHRPGWTMSVETDIIRIETGKN
jgi:hypothetical protein